MRATAILLVLALALPGCAHRPGIGSAATTWADMNQAVENLKATLGS